MAEIASHIRYSLHYRSKVCDVFNVNVGLFLNTGNWQLQHDFAMVCELFFFSYIIVGLMYG